MARKISLLAIIILFFTLIPSAALAAKPTPFGEPPRPPVQDSDEWPDPEYLEAITRTSEMVWDAEAIRLAEQYGLQILNVTWEDTGRYYDSAVGPNISDMTIQVQHRDPRTEGYNLTLMPVIRYPNFSDLTADISPDDFFLLVGNEQGENLKRVSLTEYLDNFRNYLSEPDSWMGRKTSLLAPRDSHVLVSAQAAFLPVPQQGLATFNPVIFNYQSYQGDPAVLTIIATREGTSATIIDNVRDGFPAGYSWGQRLFHNQNGERASFTGQRLSDFLSDSPPSDGGSDGQTPAGAGEAGLNMVLLIQVPLKQKTPMVFGDVAVEEDAVAMTAPVQKEEGSNVEAAVIGHGEVEGPYTEIDGLEIERDDRFPIRVTVQFYKATSNGIVSAGDMEELAGQIRRVYDEGDYVGSLVVDGPSDRPTEHDDTKSEPLNWWESFWQRYEENTGTDRWDAYNLWQRLELVARGWIGE